MEELATTALEHATNHISRQLEYELRGAWRAGYSWLHIYDSPTTYDDMGKANFQLSMYVFPAHAERPPMPDELVYRYSYDLRDIDYADINEHL